MTRAWMQSRVKHLMVVICLCLLSMLVTANLAYGEEADVVILKSLDPSADNVEWVAVPGYNAGIFDTTVYKSSPRSLRISTGEGMRTQLIPYKGAPVKVSGWIKTENVVQGAQSWQVAALQIVTYDAAGKSIGHKDVALVRGTTDWTFREKEMIFSQEVAYIAVWFYLWKTGTGTAWLDDFSLYMDNTLVVEPKPLDLTQAAVKVELNTQLGEFKRVWIGSDVSYMDRTTRPSMLNALDHAPSAGFRYVRIGDTIYNPRVYSEDAFGNPVYNWSSFDVAIDAVVRRGLWPFIVLRTMPAEIAKGDVGKGFTNPLPPKGDEGYLKWQRLIYELVKHCREKWGEDVYNWYFEVWNEPDSKGFFEGTLEEYLKVYDHAVAGATAADPNIKIGGFAGSDTAWVQPFLEHIRSGINAATGEIGARADFLSWHIYTAASGYPAFNRIDADIKKVKALLTAYGYEDLPMFVTEWGSTSQSNPSYDWPYDAAFKMLAVHKFMDGGVELAFPFCYNSNPYSTNEGFLADLGMFTLVLPKPSFRAFELLNRMSGNRIALESTNDPVNGLAALSDDGKTLWILLYNAIEKYDHPEYRTKVTLELSGLPSGDWKGEQFLIAPGECDPYRLWVEMGKPPMLSAAQRAALEKETVVEGRPITLTGNTLTFDMPGSAVLLLELSLSGK